MIHFEWDENKNINNQKKYDSSKGVKGRFYVPKEEISLPLYLNKKNKIFI